MSGSSHGRDLLLQIYFAGNIAVTSTMLWLPEFFHCLPPCVISFTKWLQSTFGDELSLDPTTVKTQPVPHHPSHCFRITRAKHQCSSKLTFPVLIRSRACVRSVAPGFDRFAQKLFLSAGFFFFFPWINWLIFHVLEWEVVAIPTFKLFKDFHYKGCLQPFLQEVSTLLLFVAGYWYAEWRIPFG